jgi:hypothetical protein
MKRLALLLIACLLLGSVSFAQQNPADAPASKEDVERYLTIMCTRDMMKTMMDNMSSHVRQRLKERLEKQASVSPEEEDRAIKMEADIFENLPIDEIINAMIPIYQRHLTKGDIEGLVAFYSTPTGQKLLKELPEISKEGMQVAIPIAQKLVRDAERRVDEELAQMQKESDSHKKNQTQQN